MMLTTVCTLVQDVSGLAGRPGLTAPPTVEVSAVVIVPRTSQLTTTRHVPAATPRPRAALYQRAVITQVSGFFSCFFSHRFFLAFSFLQSFYWVLECYIYFTRFGWWCCQGGLWVLGNAETLSCM